MIGIILGILGLLVGIVVSFLIASEFEEIAFLKGYRERKYFWFSFLFGLPGYLMVVALPTRSLVEKNRTDAPEEVVGDFPRATFSEESGIVQCPYCGTCYDADRTSCPACHRTCE